MAAMVQSPTTNDGERKTHYRSYLLRLWCAGPANSCYWQASLDDSHTGERIGFASLEELFAFLMELVVTDAQG
jgi:hypothetical protein